MSFLAVAVGCSVKEIEFSHETPSFEVKDNLILIEAIAPLGLTSTDAVFIAGPALGDSAAVVSSSKFQLEQAADMNRKWGVYLNPADFKDGKTLADGFYFVVVDKGLERTPFNKEPEHAISNATVGTVYTVYMAGSWSNDFIAREPIDIPEHKNFRIYIEDKTGWDEIRLYMYSHDGKGVDNLYAAWPGIAPAGIVELDGKDWTYFEIGPAANALEECVIFNNNNGVQTHDDPFITFDVADFFFTVTADLATRLPNLGIDKKPDLEEEPEPEPVYPTPGHSLYVQDNTGWPGEMYVHLWTAGGYSTEWPGLAVSETIEQNGKTYKVFELPGEINNDTASFIFHSDVNDGDNRVQIDGVAINAALTYVLTATEAVADAEGPSDLIHIFIQDERHWPGNLYLHMWNDDGFSTEWPGLSGKLATVNGINYMTFTAPREVTGTTVNAIIHSDENDGANRIQTVLKLDKDRYYVLGTSTIFDESVEYNPSTIYVIDKMGWAESLHLYVWGSSEIFGSWPGSAGQMTSFAGIPAKVYNIDEADAHKEAHLIFNDGTGGDGHQFDGPTIETGEDHIYVINDDFTYTEVKEFATRIYVEDNTGWAALYAYIWGTSEVFGGWPGAAFTQSEEIGGICSVWLSNMPR